MSQDITKFTSWGRKDHLYWVFSEAFINTENHTTKTLLTLSSPRFSDFGTHLEGIIFLLSSLNIIKKKGIHFALQDKNQVNKILSSGGLSSSIFLELLVQFLQSISEINRIFNNNSIMIMEEKIYLKKNFLPPTLSALRNLLINGGWIYDSNLPSLFLVHNELYGYIKNQIKPKIKLGNPVSQEALEERIKNQQKAGDEAQDFVLAYEIDKFKNHPEVDEIQDISKSNMNAGFDIKSFQRNTSASIDKAIEVKSYSGSKKIYFYWSNNEIEKAIEEKELYSLYLVNRDQMQEEGYQPKEIKNPANILLENGSVVFKDKLSSSEQTLKHSFRTSSLEFKNANKQWTLIADGWYVSLTV